MITNNNNNNYPNNNIVNNNNDSNNNNEPKPKRSDEIEWTPKNLTIFISFWSLLIIILSIVSTSVTWSRFEGYSPIGNFYFNIPLKPGGYILALIIISIIIAFFYCVALIIYINGKFPSSFNPQFINGLVILGFGFQLIVLICAFADKRDSVSLALGEPNELLEGSYIFTASTILYGALVFISWGSINSIMKDFVRNPNNNQMNSYAPNQFIPQPAPPLNQQFNSSININYNTPERQYIQNLEQYIQQLQQCQNSSQMSNVYNTLQQTIDQLTNYLGQLRNYQTQMSNSIKNMNSSIQNNTNTLSSISINNNQPYSANNINQV